MLGTNQQVQGFLTRLDRQIGALERVAVANGGTDRRVEAALAELWAQRRSLRLLVLNRRIEAAKPVVDLCRWRDGNGALQMAVSSAPKQRSRRS